MRSDTRRPRPSWAAWDAGGTPWTVGVEEELMLLDRRTGAVANRIGAVLRRAPVPLSEHLSAETHACVVELNTDPCATVGDAVAQLGGLRRAITAVLAEEHGLAAAAAGTNPLVHAAQAAITPQPRYHEIERTTRGLAHREPTMALHVHVGVPDAEAAVRAHDGLRADVPALIALAANSPFWHGEDSGFASMRLPLFSAFPRTGLPRAFGTYDDWVAAVHALVAVGAIPGPGFVWWDVRLQPRFGTVEVRAMDAQTRTADTAALVALVQCLVVAYAEGRQPQAPSPEVLDENRFLAARDGIAAQVIDAARGDRVPMHDVVRELVAVCEPIAVRLGCRAELALVSGLAHDPGATRQRRIAHRHGLAALPQRLSTQLVAPARGPAPAPASAPAPPSAPAAA